MKELSIELLSVERVDALWAQINPLLDKACEGSEFSRGYITSAELYSLLRTDKAVAFVAFCDNVAIAVLVVQFNITNIGKGADIIALAGEKLLVLKSHFWEPILQWLKANGVKTIDANADKRLANIYKKKFGFNKSCVMVRMDLGE